MERHSMNSDTNATSPVINYYTRREYKCAVTIHATNHGTQTLSTVINPLPHRSAHIATPQDNTVRINNDALSVPTIPNSQINLAVSAANSQEFPPIQAI